MLGNDLARGEATRGRILRAVLLGSALFARGAWADDAGPVRPAPDLVNQANAPISSIMQLRLQDTWVPDIAHVRGQANTFSLAVTMPLPKYRLLPVPQLSLLSVPAVNTLPDGTTGFGDVHFLDIAVLGEGPDVVWGVGPTFVFPTASARTTGLGKWQAGPAGVIAAVRRKWLLGLLAQNPVSFAGVKSRREANTLVLQPFFTYQMGNGWFMRSQPQIVYDWPSGTSIVPLDLGAGRVFRVGGQVINCVVEPFWNISHPDFTPRYGVSFGISFLYPNFWQGS